MADTNSDIVRKAGDTYPSKSVITVNGVPIDLTDWTVDARYMKDGVEWVINCVITSPKKGLVSIYPHGRVRSLIPAGDVLHPTDYVMSGDVGSNQVWDEDEADTTYPFYIVRLRTYTDGYVEEMTHNSGSIVLSSRYAS